jgi:hypothetical protein
MSTTQADDAAVREKAYLLWEADGRPEGRATEYWMRAKVAVSEKSQMDTLTKAPPRKSKGKSAEAAAPGATGKVKAAASKAKAAPAKSGKTGESKPKKK